MNQTSYRGKYQQLKTVSEGNAAATVRAEGQETVPQMENALVRKSGVSTGCQKSDWKISTIRHWSTFLDQLFFFFLLPEYGGLGGTGGHSILPPESEECGIPSLTLSRLQLLGAGLTLEYTKT